MDVECRWPPPPPSPPPEEEDWHSHSEGEDNDHTVRPTNHTRTPSSVCYPSFFHRLDETHKRERRRRISFHEIVLVLETHAKSDYDRSSLPMAELTRDDIKEVIEMRRDFIRQTPPSPPTHPIQIPRHSPPPSNSRSPPQTPSPPGTPTSSAPQPLSNPHLPTRPEDADWAAMRGILTTTPQPGHGSWTGASPVSVSAPTPDPLARPSVPAPPAPRRPMSIMSDGAWSGFAPDQAGAPAQRGRRRFSAPMDQLNVKRGGPTYHQEVHTAPPVPVSVTAAHAPASAPAVVHVQQSYPHNQLPPGFPTPVSYVHHNHHAVHTSANSHHPLPRAPIPHRYDPRRAAPSSPLSVGSSVVYAPVGDVYGNASAVHGHHMTVDLTRPATHTHPNHNQPSMHAMPTISYVPTAAPPMPTPGPGFIHPAAGMPVTVAGFGRHRQKFAWNVQAQPWVPPSPPASPENGNGNGEQAGGGGNGGEVEVGGDGMDWDRS